MTQTEAGREPVIKDLGGGLILRRATTADAQALAEFNARVHSDEGYDQPDERIAAWTQDLMERPHPTFQVGDFTLVEDTREGKIVSSLNLISQTWSYGGIEFGVGRPELVGTHPEYRNRGLVRAQFDEIHRWSADRGHLAQAITGIPWYYRQFGYEMGLALGGGRLGYPVHVPALKDGEVEPYLVRPATEADIPFLSWLYDLSEQRYLISCRRDDAQWRYEISGMSQKNVNRREVRLIVSAEGEPVGFLVHAYFLWGPSMLAEKYEIKPGISWQAVTPTVIRYLKDTGEAYASQRGKGPFGAFGFWLGTEHPVYEIILDRLPRQRAPYAWYVRVPDLAAFLMRLSSVLERRLDESHLAGHTGDLKMGFYRHGLLLRFEQGCLLAVEPWEPGIRDEGDAAFPDLTFLQLLFGYRTLAELNYAFVDCLVNNEEARPLLQTLFPKQASSIWPVC